jgi:hypothetical protein
VPPFLDPGVVNTQFLAAAPSGAGFEWFSSAAFALTVPIR